MARRKLEHKLVHINDITEELRLIENSTTDYITPTGKIYSYYFDNKYFLRQPWILYGYQYCRVKFITGFKDCRVHRLIAKAYIPNPQNLPIVGHKNNIKNDNRVENLYWTTTSENTKKAYDDGLIYNAASWDDSQSIAVAQFDLNGHFIRYYGSMSEAARNNNITKTMISFQCRHASKTKPKKGYYYRYKEEFDKYGFVL